MTRNLRVLLLTCLVFTSSVKAQSPGGLSGIILADDTSRPLAGVTVVATQHVPARPAVIRRAVTAADGTYMFDGVPPGAYALCVHAGLAYLNPCEWESPVVRAAGGPSQEIRLRRGIPVVVKLIDTFGEAADRGPKRLPPAAVTVRAGAGRDRPMAVTNRGAGAYEYSCVAPPETALRVRVSSREFLLADVSGLPIDERGHAFSVTTPSAAKASGPPKIPIPPFGAGRPGPPTVVLTVQVRGKK